MSKQLALSNALANEELESGVDLTAFITAFKHEAIMAAKHMSLDLSAIIDALKIVISDEANVYRHRGNEYALIKEKVYEQFEIRGLSRKGALATLCDAGILVRTTSPHYAKAVWISGRRQVRAIVVRLVA